MREDNQLKKVILSADIGGSHITTGLILWDSLEVVEGSVKEAPLDARAAPYEVLHRGFKPAFQAAINRISEDYTLAGIAIAMPGPFEYDRGIFRLSGLDKFGSLYGVDFKRFLYEHLFIDWAIPVFFKNDADSFGLGAYVTHASTPGTGATTNKDRQSLHPRRLIGITLGTGLGSAFVDNGITLEQNADVPAGGHLYNQPLQFMMRTADFEDDSVQEAYYAYEISEELISTRGLLQYVNNRVFDTRQRGKSRVQFTDVKSMAEFARTALDNTSKGGEVAALALEAFKVMGYGLGTCLRPWYEKFRPAKIVLGGGIAGAADLFLPAMRRTLRPASLTGPETSQIDPPQLRADDPLEISILSSEQMQSTPLIGVAYALQQNYSELVDKPAGTGPLDPGWRNTRQALLPQTTDGLPKLSTSVQLAYSMYPYHRIGAGKIHEGFISLARKLLELTVGAPGKAVALDGYPGVDWTSLQWGLSVAFRRLGVAGTWIDMASFARPAEQIESMVAPYLGSPDSVWGTKTDLNLSDFFDLGLLKTVLTKQLLYSLSGDLVIIYGTGSSLANADMPVVFVELPKNEIQYRMRAGKAGNLLCETAADFAQMYKRAYFVDWPVMEQYRERLLPAIKIFIDGTWRQDIHWCLKEDLLQAFAKLVRTPLRVRPWFAPGAWGGDWMKTRISGLDQKEQNYAWSFELIAPENGIIIESDQRLMELPFDLMMSCQSSAVLGDGARIFGNYFPIRFDFLDTFNGGNLSIQCHPSMPYIKEHFGERITQDETYYIMDTQPGAGVYLGFQEDIDPDQFLAALQRSYAENTPVEIEKYVQLLPAQKHDLFLIPNQTVHSAGAGNLVLEISATPYIFTFKMYDWLRPDLDGRPRPISIEHAFENLDFSRKGQAVREELYAEPELLSSGDDYFIYDLPTHPEHFYRIRRLEFTAVLSQHTQGKLQVMMVVEGPGVSVELPDGSAYYYNYAETIIIPAAVDNYQLVHPGADKRGSAASGNPRPIKVLQVFIK